MEYLKTIISAFLGASGVYILNLVVGVPKNLKKRSEELGDRLKATEDGVKSLLRAEIQSEYLIIKARGYCKPYEKNNISYLYKSYTALGGNSYISKLYDQIMQTDIVED